MRSFAQKAPQPTSDPRRRPIVALNPIQQLQRRLGNQALQRMAQAGKDTDARDAIRAAATLGTSGPAGPLPYRNVIQRSFGHHDVSEIAAHTDARAHAASRMMGAEGFAAGRHVAFAGPPSLHTAAHEAAHTIQQRAGVQLAGGVGRAGDRYERHADEVANRVVAGRSSEQLLDGYVTGAAGAGGGAAAQLARAPGGMQDIAVQMKERKTAYGTFEDIYYHKLTNTRGQGIGCEMYLRFTPNDKVDASKIGLTQVNKGIKEGVLRPIDETKRNQSVTSGVGKDFNVDQYSDTRNPLYVTSNPPAKDADRMEAWDEGDKVTLMTEDERKASEKDNGMKGQKYAGIGQHGYRKKSGAAWIVQPAELDDWPKFPSTVDTKNSGQYFETTALAIEGTQKDSYYGSVQWGWERDAKGIFNLVDFKVVSMGVPSANFMATAEKWNTSTTSTGEATIKLPIVEVYITSAAMDVLAGKEKINLIAKTRVQVVKKGADANTPWQVKIVHGPHTGKLVSVDGATLTRE